MIFYDISKINRYNTRYKECLYVNQIGSI
jgi:hypothetical protein